MRASGTSIIDAVDAQKEGGQGVLPDVTSAGGQGRGL